MGTSSSRSALGPVALTAASCLLLLAAARAGAEPSEPPSSSTTTTTVTTTSTAGTTAGTDVDGGPRFELRTGSLVPPVTMVGDTSTAVVEVVNVGTVPFVVDKIEMSGAGFSLRDNECGSAEVTDRCRLEVAFTPTGTGASVGVVGVRVGDVRDETSLRGEAVGASATTEPSASTVDLPETNDSPPSTEPPRTTAVPGIDAPDESELERCEREADDVDVRFAPHDEMVVGDLSEVVVVASTDELDGAADSSAGPSTTIVEVSLHCEVRAVLRGADFSIDPPGPQEASFLDSTTIEWIWQVRPLVAGTLTLRLELTPIVHTDERTLPGSPRRFETTIAVDAVEESLPDKASNFFSAVVDYPLVKGFGSLAAIGALLAAGWKWVLRKPWPWATRAAQPPTSPDTGS